MRISYPASNSGVEMARMPRGAVASMLENEATKNTIFFDDFTRTPFVLSNPGQRSGDRLACCICYRSIRKLQDSHRINRQPAVCLQIVKTVQNPAGTHVSRERKEGRTFPSVQNRDNR